MDLQKIKEAAARMSIVLPHIRAAAKEARTEGAVGLAIIMEKPDGSGRLTARFEAEEFLADLANLAAVPALLAAMTEKDKEIARLKKYEPAPQPKCGDDCPTCLKCIACGYCHCPTTPPHVDDKPAAYSLPSDAFAGVP